MARTFRYLFYFGVGAIGALVASLLHVELLQQFENLKNQWELPYLAATFLLLYLALYGLTVWQPFAIRRVVISLQPVITDGSRRALRPDEFLARTLPGGYRATVARATFVFLFIVLPVTVWVTYSSGLLFTTLHPVLLGINPFELIGPGLVLFVINDFLLTLVLIQHCVAIMRIDELISNHGISPRAFHSDGANGLGAIGGYAVVTGSLAILYGVWLSVMFGIGLNRGEAPHWGASPIILLMTYVFAVGLLAVGPLLSPHARMKAYRDLRLDAVAARIQLMLDAEADGACTVMPSDQMSGLRERYHFIRNAYGEWPVHMTAFRGFSLAALIPLVSSIVSIVAKVMKAG